MIRISIQQMILFKKIGQAFRKEVMLTKKSTENLFQATFILATIWMMALARQWVGGQKYFRETGS